jgi:predicted amidohydrolase
LHFEIEEDCKTVLLGMTEVNVFYADVMCAAGLQLVACDSPLGRLGLTVCYDLRFPEVYQRLAFDMGAQVLLVPSAFTKVTGMVTFVHRNEG